MGKAGLALDAVILAAGRGQRMQGVAKPFYKPLLELNGIPLVGYAVSYAMAAECEKIVVVASEANVADIEDAVKSATSNATVVVQKHPNGPGDATLVGLSAVTSNRSMLLMSDNIMDRSVVADMARDCAAANCDAIGIRFVSPEQASRFTRIRLLESGYYKYVEGEEVCRDDIWKFTDQVAVWCGPVVFETAIATDVLSRVAYTGELKIGPHLNLIMRDDARLYEVMAMDIGIPSAYAEAQTGVT